MRITARKAPPASAFKVVMEIWLEEGEASDKAYLMKAAKVAIEDCLVEHTRTGHRVSRQVQS